MSFAASDGMPSGPRVIPDDAFATRFIGWVAPVNDASVSHAYPLRARGVFWRDFVRLEIRHDGQRAEHPGKAAPNAQLVKERLRHLADADFADAGS
ncbi:MAG: hypothetical protein HYV63_00010 [Candidatus Schekmanbacteria bacterium]|nr:hypothetical protein [Candidatus Schekmanbacteria bacterium]